MVTSSDQIKWDKLVSSQIAIWEVRKKTRGEAEKKPEDPWDQAFITISRAYGAKGFATAQRLGEMLGWKVYGRNLVEYIAESARVRRKFIESLDEKKMSEALNWVQTILDSQTLSTDRYFKHLVSTLVSIAEHGRAIIVGRGANFILRQPFGLHVRTTAPLEWRVKSIAAKNNLDWKEAKKLVNRIDKERRDFVRRYFQKEIDDPDVYDLVINIENIPIEQAAHIILAALEQRLGCPREEVISGEPSIAKNSDEEE